MDPATISLINKVIDMALAATSFLKKAGVNYQEVIDAQAKADAEGRELSAAERQAFIDQAQADIDKL